MVGVYQDRQRKWPVSVAVFIALIAMLALVGCSSSKPVGESINKAGVNPAKVDDIAALVPDDVKQAGKLVVGVNVPYPPNEYKEGDKFVGFDIDMMNAVAAVLGLKTEYREADFATIIPSIQEGTYDAGASSFTDDKEREKQVDFVTYFNAGTLWGQRSGTPVDPNNACGLKVAVQSNTVQQDEVEGRSKACVDAGKPAINVLKFDGQDAATNAVVLGQADAVSADSPVVADAIRKSDGKLEAAGEIFNSAPYGWPVAKNSPLAQALLNALEHLIRTGDYERIATHWGVQQGMIDNPTINGAVK